MIRLLIVSAIAGAVILALVRGALRRQARRAARASAWVYTPIPLPYAPLPAPAEIEAPSWWAIGALSDARRRAADREGLAEFGVSVPLADAYIWDELTAELAARPKLGPVGWAPPTGHAVTLPADALRYDRYYAGPRCGEPVPQAVTA